jgi:hypothetical protein
MHEERHIRESKQADIYGLMQVIDAVELFPSSMLEGMMSPFLSGGRSTPEFWLTDDQNGPSGVAYCAPERLTEGTWNLYLIAGADLDSLQCPRSSLTRTEGIAI